MKQRLIGTLLLAGVLATGGAAAGAPSTIFIAEGQLGYAVGSVFPESPDGFAGRLTLGFGGKFRGWPTRIYGIANLGTASLSGTLGQGVDRAETARSWTSWSFGLRLLSPIAENLRLLADVAIGRGLVSSDATILIGAERYHTEDDSLLVELGLGLQYRLALNFSIGARVDVAIPTSLDEFDLLAELAGGSSKDSGLMNPSFLLTATLHL